MKRLWTLWPEGLVLTGIFYLFYGDVVEGRGAEEERLIAASKEVVPLLIKVEQLESKWMGSATSAADRTEKRRQFKDVERSMLKGIQQTCYEKLRKSFREQPVCMELCQDPYPESASRYANSLYLCELQILGTLSGCDLLWSEEVEGEQTHAEKRKKQEEEHFPNLLYKLEVYRSKMAAFYANRYEIKQPQYTSEEKFKEQVVKALIWEAGKQEEIALAESRSADDNEILKQRKVLQEIQSMKTPKMKECSPEFRKVFLSSDVLSCQQVLSTYTNTGNPATISEVEKAMDACVLALRNRAQELGCFSLSTEN